VAVLIWADVKNGALTELQEKLGSMMPELEMEIYRSITSLDLRLRQPKDTIAVALLLATSKKDFNDILTLRGLLDDLRTILVLPDRKKETVARGHSLRPRYLSFADGDLTDVVAVLQTMMGRVPIKQPYC
jgi:hypothetical protein